MEVPYPFSCYTFATLLDDASHDGNILWKAGHKIINLMPGLLSSSRLAYSLSGGVACHSSLRAWTRRWWLAVTAKVACSENHLIVLFREPLHVVLCENHHCYCYGKLDTVLILYFDATLCFIVFFRLFNFVSLQHFSCFAADAWVIFTSSFESKLRPWLRRLFKVTNFFFTLQKNT